MGPKITPRQKEVLVGLASSNTIKGIAQALRVSPKTVEFHKAKLGRRIGVHDIAGLTRFAIRCGFIVPCVMLLFSACVQARQYQPPVWSPMPTTKRPARLALISPASPRFVVLGWNCPECTNGSYTTGIVGGTDLTNWAEMAAFPCTNTVTAALSNLPPVIYFRAFSRNN